LHFIALTSIGIENLLVDELTDIGATVTKQTVGSVRFDADTTLAQKVCLMSRFATRVLMLIEEKAFTILLAHSLGRNGLVQRKLLQSTLMVPTTHLKIPSSQV
jgi:23S rRNA G2445 N2-methylase RlmL